MNFSKYRKTIKLEHIDTFYIDYDFIKCQYNPDLFKHWEAVCGNSMRINSTPYYYYLSYRKINKYQRLMKLYGRGDTWTVNNINKFFGLIASIDAEGVLDPPVVLTEPLKPNPYNKGLEIFEGHRRLSICLYKGIKTKVKLCRVLKT